MLKYFVIILVCVCNSLFSQKNNIPIFAFHGVPPGDFSTKEQFLTMKNAGIDICYTVFNSKEEVIKALNASHAAGTKLIISIRTLQIDIKEAIRLFKDHPGLYGYALIDEPPPSEFPNLKELILEIRKYDTKHAIYINLFPNYVSSTVIDNLSYEKYVKNFITQVPVEFISFDHYPIVGNEIRNTWYENLEIIRKISYQKNLPFWAFACSTIHYNYLQPNLSGLKLQQFSNLLYGAQVLQYFTYWTLTYEYNWTKEKYGYSIVDDKGNPTPTYHIVKKVNEQIQKLAWVFLGAKADAVFHTGNEIPQGTKKLSSLPDRFKFFSTYGMNALVSFMTNGKRKFIIVQNKSLTDDLTLEYQFDKPMKKVNNTSGKIVNLSISKRYKTDILPGDILIFTYGN